jgi:cell division protein FtsW (lipid II flippase)
MFGLVALEHALKPQTTLEKFIFLVENVFEHFHRTTTFISFGALLVLVFIRTAKGFFKKWWWIYRIPEVLIVVVVSTSMYPRIGSVRARWADLRFCGQSFPIC